MSDELFTYDLPEGTVCVRILPAVVEEWHDAERGRIRQPLPALRVTTWINGNPGSGEAFVTLRGKRYSADQVELSTPFGWKAAHQAYEVRYRRTEAGNRLDWQSPTGRKLDALLDGVRDSFVADHPDWVRVSLALRTRNNIRREEAEVARMEADAAERRVILARWRAELAELEGQGVTV